ncbi:hypothetical protein Acsp01_53850 [Actinoplanes sp. NBRC 101535]|nr:hypothetical protein Acsp01_53850 [Actinoplanes sp. NBRC 101535]
MFLARVCAEDDLPSPIGHRVFAQLDEQMLYEGVLSTHRLSSAEIAVKPATDSGVERR